MQDELNKFQQAINQRQGELNKVANILAKEARKFSLFWTSSKVTLIVSGAVAAAKGAFDRFFDADSSFNLIFFTALGLIVAIVTGLETTFKYESKNAELKVLAAECHSVTRKIDRLWIQKVGFEQDNQQIIEAKALLELQDSTLTEIQVRATKIVLI